MCRLINHSDIMKNFGKVIRNLIEPRIKVRKHGYQRLSFDDGIVSKIEDPGLLEISLTFILSEYTSEVDFRFVANNPGEEMISSFPMKLGDQF